MHTVNGEVLLSDDDNTAGYKPVVDGVAVRRGAIPRDFSVQPCPMQAVQFPLIPRTEWPERIRDKIAAKSQLSDIRNRAASGQPIKSYDQNGQGYCWAYSTVACITLARACANQPHVRLSAHSVACVVKKFRDEGGWCGLSMEYVQAKGVVPESHWPAKSMSSANDTPANWEEAKKYVVAEGWVDLDAAVYDRNLTFDQVITLLLANYPTVGDFNHWSHSVCLMDAVDGAQQRQTTRGVDGKLLDLAAFERVWALNDPRTAGIGVRLWNSWTDAWSQNGTGLLTGNKAVPDGAVSIVTPVGD